MTERDITLDEEQKILRPGLWEHYKGGLYRVLFIATLSEDHKTRMVIYVSLTNGAVWIRPAREWRQVVTLEEGRPGFLQPRFTYIEMETPL